MLLGSVYFDRSVFSLQNKHSLFGIFIPAVISYDSLIGYSYDERLGFSTEIGAFVVEKRLIPRREKYAVFNCLLIRSLCKLLFVLNFQLPKPAILFLFWDFIAELLTYMSELRMTLILHY